MERWVCGTWQIRQHTEDIEEDELVFETMRTKDHNKEGSEGERTDGPFFILELDEGKWKSPWTSNRKAGSQSLRDTNNVTYTVCLC